MSPTDPIAAFLEKGGRVVRLQETFAVTASEVVEYLVALGIEAKHSPRHPGRYFYKDKLVSLNKLILVANRHRRAEQLPLFVRRAKL